MLYGEYVDLLVADLKGRRYSVLRNVTIDNKLREESNFK